MVMAQTLILESLQTRAQQRTLGIGQVDNAEGRFVANVHPVRHGRLPVISALTETNGEVQPVRFMLGTTSMTSGLLTEAAHGQETVLGCCPRQQVD